jgi:hypothetical protein
MRTPANIAGGCACARPKVPATLFGFRLSPWSCSLGGKIVYVHGIAVDTDAMRR